MEYSVGHKFGDWELLNTKPIKKKGAYFLLVSDGYETKYVNRNNLIRGLSTCSRTKMYEVNRTKKYSIDNFFYRRWRCIKQRTQNPNNTGYHWYGGRGIRLSDEFQDSQVFCEYVSSLPRRPDQTQIDRIDNDGNYERGNLRWATPKENSNNKERK